MPLSTLQSQRRLPALSSRSTPYVAQGKITRSRHGCLTCRIRRKKCDEPAGQTVCDTCQRLKIECLGYAPRPPEWLTRGTRDAIRREIRCSRAEHGRTGNSPTLSLAKFYKSSGWLPTLAPPISEHTTILASPQPWGMPLPLTSSSQGQEISNTCFGSVHLPPHSEMSTGTIGGPFLPHHFIESSIIFFPPLGFDGMEWGLIEEDLFSDEAWAPFDHSDHSDYSW